MDQLAFLTSVFVLYCSVTVLHASNAPDVIYTPMQTRFYSSEVDVMLHLTIKKPCTLIPYMYENKLKLKQFAVTLGNKCEELFYKDTTKLLSGVCERTRNDTFLKNLPRTSREVVFKTDIATDYGPVERLDKSEEADRINFEMNLDYEADDNYRIALWRALNSTCQSGEGAKILGNVNWIIDAWIAPSFTAFLPADDECPVRLLFAKMYAKHVLVRDSVQLWRLDSLNTQMLDLFGLNDRLAYDQYSPYRCFQDTFGTYHFHLKRKVVDNATVIKRADAFKYWAITAEGYCIREYHGPKYFIHNKTAACWKPIDAREFEAMQYRDFSNASCTVRREPTTRWRYDDCVALNKPIWPLIQVKQDGGDVYLYCYPDKYFPLGEPPKDCPALPFLVRTGFSLHPASLIIKNETYKIDGSQDTGALGSVFWCLLMIILIVVGLLLKDYSTEIYDIAIKSRVMRIVRSETPPSNVEEINMRPVSLV